MGAGGGGAEGGGPPVKTGQVRKFKITALDAASKRIDVELAD